ncbi:DUF4190 domain-containing protein [Aeromicrobium sp. A1-2]|uniref:DUF4190 domain-containing protein n=1 Tax=Aeromicrobium sp. A1-2 TaxID=2107713 RepID=UPI001C1FBDFD|nr:DUF4190 domain-containing protein [Aeromicrobium sp. A1-2]
MSDQNDDFPGPTPPPGYQPPPNWGSAYPAPQPSQVPPPYYGVPPKHPQSTTALILGILGLVVCGVIAPFAWVTGSRAVREIDASQGGYGGRSEANAGKILGIIGTSILGLTLVIVVPLFASLFFI